VAGLEQWTTSDTAPYVPDIQSYPPHMREVLSQVVQSQNLIGWDNEFRRFLAKDWLAL
jgi:hypothetical protein